jgi:cytosine/creatinine deaminase
MSFDLLFKGARLADNSHGLVDIGVKDGLIADIAPHIQCDCPTENLDGKLVMGGFVDSHVHLDKSCISGRCNCVTGTLQEAIVETAKAKQNFTEEDIYSRGQKTLEKAIIQGTIAMRTHVELDPTIGLKGFHAINQLKRDYAWAIDLQICVFPQEGLLNNPGTDELLWQACEKGADIIGGCPYTDTDPKKQIARIFEIARHFNIDVDFHLDFHLDPTKSDLAEVCQQTIHHAYQGRVAIGHATQLSAQRPTDFEGEAHRLADAGIALTVLPSTDLFLMGRDVTHLVPRGVTLVHTMLRHGVNGSLATNNVLNPFTPFGDCSLIRMANLYANIGQIGDQKGLEDCFDLVSSRPAAFMKLHDYGFVIGNPATLVVLDSEDKASTIAELVQPLFAYKNGHRSFTRREILIHRP